MLAFIVSSIVFSLFFFAILAVQPSGKDRVAVVARGLRRRLARSAMFYPLALIGLVLFPVVLLCLVAWAVNPRYSPIPPLDLFVFSPYFTGALTGGVFAGVLVVWLHRLYRLKTTDSVPHVILVEGVFLVLLLLIGSSDVLAPYLQRLSGLKVAGTEISFYQAERKATAGDARLVAQDPTLPLNPSLPGRGLADLANVRAYMLRDNDYVRLSGERGLGARPKFVHFVGATFASIASCHVAIHAATGNQTFTREQFAQLLPPLRSYKRVITFEGPAQPGSDFANTLSGSENYLGDILASIAERTFDAGIEVEVVPYAATLQVQGKRLSKDDPVGIRLLEEGCLGLLTFPCQPENYQDVPQHRDWPLRQGYCQLVCPNVDTDLEDVWPRCRPDYARMSPPDGQFLQEYMRTVLPGMAREAMLDGRGDEVRQPYWSMIYASVAAAIGQTDVANQELTIWLRLRRAEAGFDWYRVRVLSLLVNLVEESIRGATAPPSIMQVFLLDRYQALIEATNLNFIRVGRGYFLKQSGARSQESVDVNGHDSGVCTPPDGMSEQEFRRYLGAADTQITAMINYVDRALDRADYPDHYAPTVAGYLSELNALDFSCLKVLANESWPVAARVRHAEILRLNAKRALSDAADTQTGRPPEEVRKSLQNAVWAAQAARRLLVDDRNILLFRRQGADDYFKTIAGSEVIDAYDHAEQTLALVSAQLAAQ